MPRVSNELVERTLNVSPSARPVKHKLCCFAHDRKGIIKKEINVLLNTRFIRKVLQVGC
jgi:hypothetical protein